MKVPTREQAEELLLWAHEQNPGGWLQHSRGVALAAERIAGECGMDADAAYVMGLLHDIGRYEGVRALHHVLAGYSLMLERGYPDAARICLTHSFACQELNSYLGSQDDCTPEEIAFLESELALAKFDDYDRLIQLCDGLAWGTGVCIMEKRFIEVALRHGMNPKTPEKWRAHFQIKERFEAKLGRSIYSLFDHVLENSI